MLGTVWKSFTEHIYFLFQPSDGNSIDVSVINLLRVEVANAIGRSDQVAAAQIQEAIRTVKQLGLDG